MRDWNRRLFDALIPPPRGTTYNAYLIIGKDKKALIDIVNPGFEEELKEKICLVINPTEIGYIIMNHAEPDHAGAIPYMMRISSKAKLITSVKGARMAQTFYKVPENRIIIVKDKEEISLGDKTLLFIEALMLHWPETIFTYVKEDRILFSCDFFGSHLAGGVYSEEVEDYLVHAQRYWGEIMMPFRAMAHRALDKITGLDIRVIAPGHGPIHRKPELILGAYRRWASGETRLKAVIVYVSMWGNTEVMVKQIAEVLASEGIELAIHNLSITDIGDLAKDLVDSRAIVFGTPTVLGRAHPLAVYAIYLFKILRPLIKYAVILSSYGWSGGAVKQIQELLSDFKIEVIGTLEVNGPPTEENIQQIIAIAKSLAQKIKGET